MSVITKKPWKLLPQKNKINKSSDQIILQNWGIINLMKNGLHFFNNEIKLNLNGRLHWLSPMRLGLSERKSLLVCMWKHYPLTMFGCSSGSSRPSGRLRLRAGWLHTTLLSQDGGPTGGSLGIWSSENSPSALSKPKHTQKTTLPYLKVTPKLFKSGYV